MSRLILFTILIAAFASTQPNKTAYGQDEFQPAFARTLEQAIDPSVLETERSLAVPERVRPKRLPAAQVKSTPRLPSRQLAEQFYAPSISTATFTVHQLNHANRQLNAQCVLPKSRLPCYLFNYLAESNESQAIHKWIQLGHANRQLFRKQPNRLTWMFR